MNQQIPEDRYFGTIWPGIINKVQDQAKGFGHTKNSER